MPRGADGLFEKRPGEKPENRCGGVLDQGEKPILLMDLPGGGRLRVDGARPVPSEGHPCLLHLPPQRLLLLTGGNENISC